jgi:1-acyl-sn-glycerol-3-phosphate acyltransferase
VRPLSDIALTALRAAGLAAVLAQVKADFHLRRRRRGSTLTACERAGWLHASCGVALRRIGVEVTAEGEPPRHGLLVSNHLSYLDVLVYASLFPCLFVAKQEVAGWLLFGQFATMAGTIYVNRERGAANRSATAAMEQALRDGLPVVLFPEGTSSDGSSVLPFRSPFFEPAMQAEALVSPAAIGYSSETAAESRLAYYGDDAFAPHLLRTLGQRQVRAHVAFGGARSYADRKRAASGTQAEVEAMRARLLAGRHRPDGPVAQQATVTMAG